MAKHETYIPKPIDIRSILLSYLNMWHLFAGCLVLCLIAAVAFNKLSSPMYRVSASVLINERSALNTQTSSGPINSFGLFNNNNSFQNQMVLLNSSSLIFQSIQEIGMDVNYYKKDFFQQTEIYDHSPFIIKYDSSSLIPVNIYFSIRFLSQNSFLIKAKKKEVKLYNYTTHVVEHQLKKIDINQEYSIGEEIKGDGYSFRIVIKPHHQEMLDLKTEYAFKFNNIKALTRSYKKSFVIEAENREVTVANISLKTGNIKKAKDLINRILENFLQQELERKNHLAINTIRYIDSQLRDISDSLRYTENQLQNFRSRNPVINITDATSRTFDRLADLENEKAALQVQLKYYKYLQEYLQEENKDDVTDLIVPSSMGITDPIFNSSIQQLATLIGEKQALLDNNQRKSPYLKRLNIEIDNLTKTINENVNYMINTTRLGAQDVDQRIRKINSELNLLPKTEQELYGLERRFNLNDAVYTYLLEKRAEAQIARASNLPDNQIVEYADIEGDKPVYPIKKFNLFLGLVLGLFLPFTYIRLKMLLRNKVYSQDELEFDPDIHTLGEFFHNAHSSDIVLTTHPNSSVSESIRKVRSNMDFYLDKEGSKTILITSSIAHEGKSFACLNLATSFALRGKSTLLIGYDLRKPKIYNQFVSPSKIGVSDYLISKANLDDIITRTDINNLDYITAGTKPPNPSDLIGSEKNQKLITELKERYEYIVFDTPPIGVVSDAMMLMDAADLILYVVRNNLVPKDFLKREIRQLKAKKIKNLCLLFNDAKYERSSYHYGYGYYTDIKDKKKKRQS